MKIKLNKFRVIDLFSGCGGLSLGIQNAGFNVVAGFDNWGLAIDVYHQNFNHQAFIVDLRIIKEDFDIFKKLNPDIIAGGPPCQDFSSAGKRDETLGRGDLTISFAEIVAAVKPKFFIMENVDRFAKSIKYQEAKKIFKIAKYGLTEKILDASLCSVPQNRKRFFWIGELNGEDRRLESYLETGLSNKPMTIRQYFRQTGKTLDVEHYYRHPRSYKRRGVFSIDEPSPTIRGVNRPIPKTYKPHPGDSAPISSVIRSLTTLERSCLQTFPETFTFEGSKTDIEQMIGNAVPVNLAEHVARSLAQYITDCSEKPFENFSNQAKMLPIATESYL
ncbi:DNA cytosine methyltransferase [Dendronalium sp. ChiSLP03b]|uniref:DNA cytosine methyltransferase n=1 Tax=Dendronalium sp. ChiSLP03b TaxID=3075381 RepID=UPI002AD20BE2|nr:DNA cytosine methyltransferase [Dendronalium sp. ChiSLP03b]MDZ8203587.1 DNA cytosine methyltransferase [Dendronalium sp. ChiSLP03b]